MSDELKIDASLKDIIFERDFKEEINRELKSLLSAQAFMWLAIQFVNNNAQTITSQELSSQVWGGSKDESYCMRILKRFEHLHILKSVRQPNTKVRYFSLTANKKMLLELAPKAMERIKQAKEEMEGDKK